MSKFGTSIKSIVKPIIPNRLLDYYYGKRVQSDLKGLIRPTDVFLVGHPKSGNTWLAYMLATVLRSRFDVAPTLGNIKQFLPYLPAQDSALRFHEQHPDPRVFRTEGPEYPELYPKTIYIVRDPRAALVSYFHHNVHMSPDAGWTMDSFLDEIMEHGCVRQAEPHLIRWDRQVLQWLRRAEQQPVKIVQYEAMKQDRRRVLEEVVEFAGIDCTERDVDLAVELSSFENMRNSERKHGAEPYRGTKGERGFFVRRGTVAGWRDELTEQQSRRIETEFSDAMQALGYH